MPALSRSAMRRLLWVVAALFLPLPYVVLASGTVPVLRFAILGGVVTAYGLMAGTSVVGWTVAALLLAHALVYAALLAVAARLAVRTLPPTTPLLPIVIAVTAVAVICTAFPIYHTPFDGVAAYTTWWGLLQ